MNETNWNLRTETLDSIAEDALSRENGGIIVEMVRIGTRLERESFDHNEEDHREAAYHCAVAVSHAYTDEVARIAHDVWVSREDELSDLAICEEDVYDFLCGAFYDEAMGISYA